MRETGRVKDGIHEHKHETHPFWHPKSRVHTNMLWVATNPHETIWKSEIDDVYDIIEAMHVAQPYYIDVYGSNEDIYPAVDDIYDNIPDGDIDMDWAQDVSKIEGITVTATFEDGEFASMLLISRFGNILVRDGYITYEKDSYIHDAKILIEIGLAEKYIPFPDILDAMHILHVSGTYARYYDLIRLPSGGHIPTPILERDYGVSWETIAKIPIGKPRDYDTFACPICGRESYYSGICQECQCDADDETFNEAGDRKIARKEAEHGEILRMIKSGNWKGCRYMRG